MPNFGAEKLQYCEENVIRNIVQSIRHRIPILGPNCVATGLYLPVKCKFDTVTSDCSDCLLGRGGRRQLGLTVHKPQL